MLPFSKSSQKAASAAQPETTDSVLESFRTHIKRLEGVVEAHCNIADLKRQAAAEAHAIAEAAQAEARKASEAIGKLQAVFG